MPKDSLAITRLYCITDTLKIKQRLKKQKSTPSIALKNILTHLEKLGEIRFISLQFSLFLMRNYYNMHVLFLYNSTQLLMRNYYFYVNYLCFLMRSICFLLLRITINVLSAQRLMRKYDYIHISLVLHGKKYDYKRLCITSDS
jgi:hypothetical protein